MRRVPTGGARPALTPRLTDPLILAGRTAPSRVLSGPHQTNLGRRRAISDRHVAYHARRAVGGAGIVVTEMASVHAADHSYERATPSVAELLAARGCTVEVTTSAMVVGQDLGLTLDMERWQQQAAALGIRQSTDRLVRGVAAGERLIVNLVEHPTGSAEFRVVDWVVVATHPGPPTSCGASCPATDWRSTASATASPRGGRTLPPGRASRPPVGSDRVKPQRRTERAARRSTGRARTRTWRSAVGRAPR
jgi:hypothetical protein